MQCNIEKNIKKQQQRSRAINSIIAKITHEEWFKLSISKKDKEIKKELALIKKRTKEWRKEVKEINREYCGYYSKCHASWLKEIQMYLFFYYKKNLLTILN